MNVFSIIITKLFLLSFNVPLIYFQFLKMSTYCIIIKVLNNVYFINASDKIRSYFYCILFFGKQNILPKTLCRFLPILIGSIKKRKKNYFLHSETLERKIIIFQNKILYSDCSE